MDLKIIVKEKSTKIYLDGQPLHDVISYTIGQKEWGEGYALKLELAIPPEKIQFVNEAQKISQ